jgi:hypothetical protein
LAVAILISLAALYSAAFYAWVTATPVTPERLRRAQLLCYGSVAAFLVSATIAIVIVVRMRRNRR